MSYFVLRILFVVFRLFLVRMNIIYLINCIYRIPESSCLSWGDWIKEENLGDQKVILEDNEEGVLTELADICGQGTVLAALSFLIRTKWDGDGQQRV